MDTERKGTLSEVYNIIDLTNKPGDPAKIGETLLKLMDDASLLGGSTSSLVLLLVNNGRLQPTLQHGIIAQEQLEAISVLYDRIDPNVIHSIDLRNAAESAHSSEQRDEGNSGNFLQSFPMVDSQHLLIGVLCAIGNKKHPYTAKKMRLIQSMLQRTGSLVESLVLLHQLSDAQGTSVSDPEYVPSVLDDFWELDQEIPDLFMGTRPVHRSIEEELRISVESFRGNFENAAVGMALLDEKGKWLRVNKRVCEIVGYTESELLQLTFQDITHPDDLDADLNLLGELVRGERDHYQMEKRYFNKNGSIVYIILAVSLVRDRSGGVLHFISQIIDITNLKETKIELKQALAKNQAILNASTQVAIISTNQQGIISTFNSGAENILGYQETETLRKNFHQLFLFHEHIVQDPYGPKKTVEEIISFDKLVELPRSGNRKPIELSLVHKNGHKIPVLLSITEITLNGKQNGFLMVATDISPLKQIQSQLDQKNKELEQFAYIAAHDLQEPLRSITSFLSLIEKKYADQLDIKAQQYIHYTIDAAARMKLLITDILNFSKADILTYETVDLNEVVHTIIASFQQDSKHQHAEFKVGELPVITSDPTTVYQLFSNLISNALKYQRQGNVPKIRIEAIENSDNWMFKVFDNGIGIDPRHYNKVFEVFKRLHNKSEYSGSGIGLATCKKIVRLYGGDIWISPNPEGGTVFSFTFAKNH